jgi:hypothetical protein
VDPDVQRVLSEVMLADAIHFLLQAPPSCWLASQAVGYCGFSHTLQPQVRIFIVLGMDPES